MFGPHFGPNPDFGFGPRKWSGPCRASLYGNFENGVTAPPT